MQRLGKAIGTRGLGGPKTPGGIWGKAAPSALCPLCPLAAIARDSHAGGDPGRYLREGLGGGKPSRKPEGARGRKGSRTFQNPTVAGCRTNPWVRMLALV